MTKRKHRKKVKQVPCTDTNQHARERIARREKQEAYMLRKIQQLREQMDAQQAIVPPVAPQQIDGMQPAN